MLINTTKGTLINARKWLYFSRLGFVKIFKLIFRNTFPVRDVLGLKRVLGSVTLLTTTQTVNKIWHARLKLQGTKSWCV
jgi:hypothetical protein